MIGMKTPLLKVTTLVVVALALGACSTLTREPAAQPPVSRATVLDLDTGTIRYLPFEDVAVIQNGIAEAYRVETPENYDTGSEGERTYNYLAISGGGSNGAFGAGLLHGWTEAGSRPRFKIVTGVSTGSLIAPFAFLGPDYDDEMKAAYTTIDSGRIFIARGLLPLLWSEAIASTEPLQELIGTFVDEKLLDAIAVEHGKGRRLYVASTNLDAEQPVVWDMGAIAASGKPDRLALFRKVLLASASIPSIFPPVLIDVSADGQMHQEMHVDGGVIFQSFSAGAPVDLPATIRAAHPEFNGKVLQNLYVIRNGWLTPSFEPVDRALTSITVRAINTMLKISGINDLWRLYLAARDDEVAFHYVAIPAAYVSSTTEQFNREEMNRQFDFARQMALDGIEWQSSPPGYTAPQSQITQQ